MDALMGSGPIDPATLPEDGYFLALLDRGYRLGLVSAPALETIQSGCMTLLRGVLEGYTRGESSSVREETAQSLLDGVCFTLSVALKACGTPDTALAMLLDEGVEPLYRRGQTRIHRKLRLIRTLHRQLVRDRFATPNVYYNATLTGGIGGYLKLCQPELTPQELYITADYPTCVPMGSLRGVEFMERYVSYITYEDRFLRSFAPAAVHRLLLEQDPTYPETPMNLLEPVLTQTLGCALAGRITGTLLLDIGALTGLTRLLTRRTRQEIRSLLTGALPSGFGGETDAYLRRCLDPISHRVYEAMTRGTPDRVFTVT